MRKIKLTKKFATHGKGKVLTVGGTLASTLVRDKKVAVYVDKIGEADALLTKERKAQLAKTALQKVIKMREDAFFKKEIARINTEIDAGNAVELKKALVSKLLKELE